MRSLFSPVRPVVSVLALSTFAHLLSCGGHSSSSSADKGSDGGALGSDEKSLFVAGVLSLDVTECLAKADVSAPRLSQGVLDLAFASSYTAFVLVGNQLPRAGSPTETERVALSGAEITLTTEDGTVLKSYSTIGTGFVDAATGSAAYGTMSVSVIPAALGASETVQSAQLLVAKIRVLGEALDGTKLTSSELDLPIKVCNGCLVQYPASAADPTQPAGSGYRCATSDTTTPGASPLPCIMGQDVAFSCLTCSASIALCRDPSLNPSFSQ
ncbi:MAG TPA: hypothetical protein VIK01_27905 [Polyangiaceae bacterium]